MLEESSLNTGRHKPAENQVVGLGGQLQATPAMQQLSDVTGGIFRQLGGWFIPPPIKGSNVKWNNALIAINSAGG